MPDLRKRRFRIARRTPRPVAPVGIQTAYLAGIRRHLAFARRLVDERLVRRLPEMVSRADSLEHQDAQSAHRRVSVILDGISRAVARQLSHDRLERLANGIAASTSEHQKTELWRQIRVSAGVELGRVVDKGIRGRVDAFTARNVSLIRSVPATYLQQVERTVVDGLTLGLRHETIAENLDERAGVAAARAKTIARDQVNKFVGELNGVRQQALGVDSYTWRTVHDSRVRADHVERDGQVYRWDDPPGESDDPATGGHPGAAINCRCWADPNLEALLNGEDE